MSLRLLHGSGPDLVSQPSEPPTFFLECVSHCAPRAATQHKSTIRRPNCNTWKSRKTCGERHGRADKRAGERGGHPSAVTPYPVARSTASKKPHPSFFWSCSQHPSSASNRFIQCNNAQLFRNQIMEKSSGTKTKFETEFRFGRALRGLLKAGGGYLCSLVEVVVLPLADEILRRQGPSRERCDRKEARSRPRKYAGTLELVWPQPEPFNQSHGYRLLLKS